MQRRNWRNSDRTFLSLSLFVPSFGSEARRSSLSANYLSSRDSPSLQSHRLGPTPQSFTTLPRKRIHRSSTRIKSTCVILEHNSLTVLLSRSTSVFSHFRRSATSFTTKSSFVAVSLELYISVHRQKKKRDAIPECCKVTSLSIR